MLSLCHTSTTLTFPQAPEYPLMVASGVLCAFVSSVPGMPLLDVTSLHTFERTPTVKHQNRIPGSRGVGLMILVVSCHIRSKSYEWVQNTVFIQNIAQIFTYTADKTGIILSPSTQPLISTWYESGSISWHSVAPRNGGGGTDLMM